MFRGQITRGLWRIYTQRLTPAGRWMLLVSAILVGYGGSSLQIQAYVLAAYLIFVWIVAMTAAVLLKPKMSLDVEMPYRVGAGDALTATLRLRQRRFVHGGDVSVAPFNLPSHIDAMPPDGVALSDLRRGAEQVAKLKLQFRQRGLQHLRGFRVTSSFPFGIIRSRQTIRLARSVLVYPSFMPLQQFQVPQGAGREANADLIASRLGESFEFLGNREFRQGDSPRDINWRATARMSQPIVREWIEERQVRVSIFLDDYITAPLMQRRLESFERSISLTAAVGEFVLRQGISLRQVLVGEAIELEGSAHRPPDLQSVLDMLAMVQPAAKLPSRIPPALLAAVERGDVAVLVLQTYDSERQRWVQEIAAMTNSVRIIVVHDTNAQVTTQGGGPVTHLVPEQFSSGLSRL